MKRPRVEVAVGGLLVAVALLRWWGPLSGGSAFVAEDIPVLNLPVRAYLGEWLRHNVLVLWSPLLQRGYPLFAESQMGGGYPLRALHALPLAPSTVLAWTIVIHLLWAAAGAYAYLRAVGLRPAAAGLPAAAAIFAAHFVARHQHTNVLEALSWWPWLLATTELAVRRKQARLWALAGLCAGLMALAGHVQYVVYGTSLAVMYGLYRLGQERDTKSLRGLGLALAIAAGLAAAQYLPLAELRPHSLRAGGVWESGEQVLKPAHLPLLLAPGFWGPMFEPRLSHPAQRWEVTAYVGLLPLLIALVGLTRPGLPRFWGVVALLGLLGAVGDRLGLYQALGLLPGWGGFRAPARLLSFYAFGLLFLAGFGAEEVLAGRWRWSRGWSRWTAMVLVSGAAAALLLPPMAERLAPGSGSHARAALVLFLALAVLSLGALRRGRAEWLLAVVLLDGLATSWTITPTLPAGALVPPEAPAGRVAVGPGRGPELFWYRPDTNLLSGTANLFNMSPLALREPMELLTAAEQHRGGRERYLAWLGARWVEGGSGLVPAPLAPWPEAWRPGTGGHGVRIAGPSPNREVYRLPGPGSWLFNTSPYPGRRLWVDGRPAHWVTAQRIMVGAEVLGEGEHEARLVLDSSSIRMGRFLALLTLATLAGIAAGDRRE